VRINIFLFLWNIYIFKSLLNISHQTIQSIVAHIEFKNILATIVEFIFELLLYKLCKKPMAIHEHTYHGRLSLPPLSSFYYFYLCIPSCKNWAKLERLALAFKRPILHANGSWSSNGDVSSSTSSSITSVTDDCENLASNDLQLLSFFGTMGHYIYFLFRFWVLLLVEQVHKRNLLDY
jgi:hypothetical protein